jgi:hypothetical protein
MKTHFKSVWIALAIIASTLTYGLTGCDTTDRAAEGQPTFSIRASNDEVFTGEIVTLTTRSSNLAGRQSQVEWSSTGGDINTEENGRIARVQFDRPGKYTVSARLQVDDQLVESDSVSIDVRPVSVR